MQDVYIVREYILPQQVSPTEQAPLATHTSWTPRPIPLSSPLPWPSIPSPGPSMPAAALSPKRPLTPRFRVFWLSEA